MPDSINSLSPDFRDFLLNRNLITDSVTNNGLDGLLVGIGVPFSNIGTPPEAVQASPDILVDGDLYKDLNLVTNKFQGNEFDYRLASITYQSSITPPASAFIYSASYTEDDGVLNDTLNAPANGAFQGGDIRQFNTSKNLYDDPSMRLTVNMDDVLLPNVKYTNYIDLNSSIVNPAIDVLGSIFNGQGVGISPTGGGLVPTFDLRSSLVGRVLGGTGVIADTPIGQAGAKYLAIALANNAAFGLQQETLGNLNLNPLNIAKNGLGGIIVPNYDITVPSGKLGKVLDFGAKVLGFESPFSLYERGASIFTSENPISNIDRANAQLANTGKGQVLALFANIKSNRYRPAFQDDRVKGDAQSEEEKATKGSALNPNVYAFGTSEGKILDFLNNNVDIDGDGNIVDGEGSDVNTPISQSNYNLDGLVRDSGFESLDNLSVSYSNPFNGEGKTPDNGTTGFIWSDNNRNYLGARELGAYDGTEFKNDKTILARTQRLFNSGKMRTLTTGKSIQQNRTQINSAVAGEQGSEYMSKGSGVLKHNSPTEIESDADNMFCRVWTTFDKYDQVQDLQKSSGINGQTAYRAGLVDGDSVLGSNGFVKIAPYAGDEKSGDDGDNNIKNFMFSLENLAWADNHENLLACELGPGDPMGKRGRIMWFPPYDISITENTSVSWESTNFIGRGEPIYTYNNTERTGTLQFKIVVDHPSYLNALKGETDAYIASFFAGCTDIDSELAKKLTTVEKNEIETRNAPPAQKKDPTPQDPGIKELVIYLPNDVSVPDSNYEDKATTVIDDGGTTTDSGTVSFTKATSTNRTNFGLNGDKNDTLGDKGGWITTAGVDALKEALNEKCPACTIDVKGFASQQGQVLNPNGNKQIQIDRANEMRKWLEENVLSADPNIVSGKITYNDRFKPFTDANKAGGIEECGDSVVDGVNDTDCLKKARKATANFTFDADLALKLTDNEVDPVLPVKEKYRVSQKIVNRFYNECNYFEKLRQEDAVVFSSLKEKLKFFHPAFHAITPEGLNSRLTFLQQCTRQGPTNSDNTPDNLAFGRPPVCILRLGDFYHTKIVIDNIGVSYEPLVWDLNPEGIGVQPMIATVDLSFKMIGGQSMKGPINKLQNAVSFNFFGNTQIYDERADTLVKNTDTETGEGEYKLVPGQKAIRDIDDNTKTEEKLGINGDGDETAGVDQPALVEKQPVEEQEPDETTINNIEVGRNIGLKSFYYDADGFELELTCTYGGKEFLLAPINSEDKTTSPIKCEVIVIDGGSTTREQKTIGNFTISHNSPTNTVIENGTPNVADSGVKEFKVSLTDYDDDVAEFLNTAIANGSNIKILKSVGGKSAGKYNLNFNNTINTFE